MRDTVKYRRPTLGFVTNIILTFCFFAMRLAVTSSLFLSSLVVPWIGLTALAHPTVDSLTKRSPSTSNQRPTLNQLASGRQNTAFKEQKHYQNSQFIKSNLQKDAKIIQQGAKTGDLKAVCKGLACGARDATRLTGEKTAQLGRKLVGNGQMSAKSYQAVRAKQQTYLEQGTRRKATLKAMQKRDVAIVGVQRTSGLDVV